MTRYLPLLVGVLAAAVCIRLGVWQLDRLEQRRALNDLTATQLQHQPMSLDAAAVRAALATGSEELRFRAVTAAGTFDFDRELVVIGRSDNGRPGVHLVTPLLLDDSTAVLVERGFLPSADGRTVDDAATIEPPDVTVDGVLLQAQGRAVTPEGAVDWPLHVVSPDPGSVASLYPYTVLPLVLRRATVPEGTAFRVVPLPERNEGPHLSYALQWFGFATIALLGSTILFVRRRWDAAPRGPSAPA